MIRILPAKAQHALDLQHGGDHGPDHTRSVADLHGQADAVRPWVGGQAVNHQLAAELGALCLEGGSCVTGGLGVARHGGNGKGAAAPRDVALGLVGAHGVPRHHGRGQLRIAEEGAEAGSDNDEQQQRGVHMVCQSG